MQTSDVAEPAKKTEFEIEKESLWGEYAKRCFDVGRLKDLLTIKDGELRKLEKELEIAERAVRSAANKHDEHVLKNLKPEVTQ